MLTVLFALITIHTSFEAGNLGEVQPLADHHYRCAVRGQADQDGRNRQASWYYFRVDGAAGKPLTIDLVHLTGEYNYRPGAHPVNANTRPVFSYDNNAWRHFFANQVSWNEEKKQLRLRFTPERNSVWIAHCPPYTHYHLRRLLNDIAGHPHLRHTCAGRSVLNREIPLLTITDPAAADSGKKVAWLMFRQHAWETGTSWVGEGLIRFLLSADAAAVRFRRGVIFQIFPMADPDGVALGGVRFNVHGFDLNRNWDAVEPLRMPEIAAQRKAILGWLDSGKRLDFFLTLHNTERAEYLEGPAPDPLLERIHTYLLNQTTFHPSTPKLRFAPPSTTPGKPGRMTVAQGLYRDRRILAATMEQRIEYNEKLGRYPTVEDRLRFGAELARAIGESLLATR